MPLLSLVFLSLASYGLGAIQLFLSYSRPVTVSAFDANSSIVSNRDTRPRLRLATQSGISHTSVVTTHTTHTHAVATTFSNAGPVLAL